MRLVASALAALFAIGLGTAAAADLRVTIKGIRNDRGRVYATLFDRKELWLDSEHSVQDLSVEAQKGDVAITFHDVAPGRYAVVTFHDENGNNKMDFSFLGLPTEGYAFSNQARPFLSAPSFERCAFTVEGAAIGISIDMVYP
jgi:uncharacterized protein (DUF2141 family)